MVIPLSVGFFAKSLQTFYCPTTWEGLNSPLWMNVAKGNDKKWCFFDKK
jgi:hypothetical protein